MKPGNVVLTEAGQPKILDFGIAALMGADPNAVKLTQTGMIVGSLPYMAPEQLTDDPADARTDIYALGVLLFEMATGRRPFLKARPEALMFEIFSTAAPSLQSIRPDIPAALDQLVEACLRKEPGQRPASAAQVAESLRAIGSGATSGALPAAARSAVRAISRLEGHGASRRSRGRGRLGRATRARTRPLTWRRVDLTRIDRRALRRCGGWHARTAEGDRAQPQPRDGAQPPRAHLVRLRASRAGARGRQPLDQA